LPNSVKKIISGGQTGVDRAAFDFALEHCFDVGGYVPKGRRAEDGRIPDNYSGLIETDSDDPAERTQLNVMHSDATLILVNRDLSGGTKLTETFARTTRKPLLVIGFAELSVDEAVRTLNDWLTAVKPKVLNIAGPRASEVPEVYDLAFQLLDRAFFGGSKV